MKHQIDPRIPSSLAGLQGKSMDTHRIKRDGWIGEQILVVTPDDAQRLNPIEQQVVRRIGNKLYGEKLNGR